jgi:anthraniloyl-CoA monooxygenase
VLRIQNAARNSTEWFENVDRYAHLPPEQFAYSLLTRSQRISHENLRLRDPATSSDYEHWIAKRLACVRSPASSRCRRCSRRITLRGVTLKNRVVVSPMAQYSCTDGLPADYHLVHLGARAMGGAGMVIAEMTCTSPDARITPAARGCGTMRSAMAGSASSTSCTRTATPRSPSSWATPAPRAPPASPGKGSTSRWPMRPPTGR